MNTQAEIARLKQAVRDLEDRVADLEVEDQEQGSDAIGFEVDGDELDEDNEY